MDRSNQVMGWVLGVIIVALVLIAAWWYANSGTVGIPNTGDNGTTQTQPLNTSTDGTGTATF